MGAPSYNLWIDPGAEAISRKQYGIADEVGGISNKLTTHSDLTDIGEGELAAIKAGRFGDTLFGGNLKQQTARANQGLRNNAALGANALARGGNSPNAGLLYERGLQRGMNRNEQAAQDALSRGMVTYPGVAGTWAQTDNNLLANQARMKALESNLYGQGWNTQRSGTIYNKKSSIWDKLGKIAGVAGGALTGFLTGGPLGAVEGGLGGLSGVGSRGGVAGAGGGGGGYAEGQYDDPLSSWWGGVTRGGPTVTNSNIYMDSNMPDNTLEDPLGILNGLGGGAGGGLFG